MKTDKKKLLKQRKAQKLDITQEQVERLIDDNIKQRTEEIFMELDKLFETVNAPLIKLDVIFRKEFEEIKARFLENG